MSSTRESWYPRRVKARAAAFRSRSRMARPFWVGGEGRGSTLSSASSDIVFSLGVLDAALKVSNMISVSLLNASVFARKNEFEEALARRARLRRAEETGLWNRRQLSLFSISGTTSPMRGCARGLAARALACG